MLLQVKDLKTYFFTRQGVVRAVDGVTYNLAEGEMLGVVGESGSGKSISALSILRLIDQAQGRIVNGEIIFEGEDLLKLSEEEIIKMQLEEARVKVEKKEEPKKEEPKEDA